MNQDRAQQLVVGCLAASAAVAAGSSLAEDGDLPGMRLVIGVAFTGVGLATVAMFAPDLAGAFAVLVLTSTVFVYGAPLMDYVSTATGATSSSSTPTRPRPRRKKRIVLA